ncbi:MAG TPA: 1,6-anhydro-N-acetylmuramyl-L-alanine amidase AmpD [Chromatiales bacterium]|nr:1,6-anhydro-N-acetylmuramyl-L-alanine amidase AmpD [Chromatiales bacterium]
MPNVIDNGWLTSACHRPSPNCDERPKDSAINLLVIHGISLPPGEFGEGWIEDLFCNQLDPEAHPAFAELSELQVSAHLLIRRDGSVVQFVPFAKRAWHAGKSAFAGRERCNDYSIGIELEGTDECPYAAAQYRVLARLARHLMECYPAITPQRIVGHSDVAPGRKTDPGPSFDWPLFRSML